MCKGGTTKSIRDDDVGKTRSGSMPKCPRYYSGESCSRGRVTEETPNTAANSPDSTVCQTVYYSDKNIFFTLRGNLKMVNSTYFVLRFFRSQAESQFGEALKNQRMQKSNRWWKERYSGAWWCSGKSNEMFTPPPAEICTATLTLNSYLLIHRGTCILL